MDLIPLRLVPGDCWADEVLPQAQVLHLAQVD